MTTAAYFRAWRAAHPEYRTRQNQLRNERRRLLGRDRSAEYAGRRRRRADRVIPPIPSLHSGHPLFDQARAIVGPDRSVLTVLRDPLYDDLISVATLAMLRGQDARAEVQRFRAVEMGWRRRICPLFLEGVAA